ncbi:hypothetical protein Rhal01_01459 [Rubritalea halochordaticola]|uniref:YHYH domain-containing protein n=1 Tax=Rubritalea halochordaticola TaxID=714537 RepID=A0ABP9UXU7_9BACT
MKKLITVVVSSGCICGLLHAHEGAHEKTSRKASVGEAKNEVQIKVEGDKRVITANGIPVHGTGSFPNRHNPNEIRVQNYRFEVPVTPKKLDRPRNALGQVFGVAVNGVVFDPGTAETWNNDRRWSYEALTSKLNLGLDENHAHVQPTGAYHYHGMPNGLLIELKANKQEMTLIGWAADGYPIYALYGHKEAADSKSSLIKLKSSYKLKTGKRDGGPGGKPDGSFAQDFEYVQGAGDLDECNGREGVTPEFPDGTYYYVLTEDFPFIPRLFRGEPDPSFEHRGGPRGGRERGPHHERGRPDRREDHRRPDHRGDHRRPDGDGPPPHPPHPPR